MKTTQLFLLAITLASVGLFWRQYSNQNNSPKNSDTLVMGIAAGYAPFISINQKNEYEGFDIDVANAIAQKLNKKLILKDMGSMAPLLMSIDQNQVDAIIWGLEMTKERLQKFSMVNYQGEKNTSYPLIFWQTIPSNIKSLEDLSSKTVCIEPSSSQAQVLKKYQGITLRPTERVDDALIALQYKKADAAFVEPAIAKKFKQKFPQVQILDIPLDPEDQVEGCGIALKKGNKDLEAALQKAVAELKQEGVIATFEKKWGIE